MNHVEEIRREKEIKAIVSDDIKCEKIFDNFKESRNEEIKKNVNNESCKKKVRFDIKEELRHATSLSDDGKNIWNENNINFNEINADMKIIGEQGIFRNDSHPSTTVSSTCNELNKINEKRNIKQEKREYKDNASSGNFNNETSWKEEKLGEDCTSTQKKLKEGKVKKMIQLRNLDLSYDQKCEKLKTINKMGKKKKMFKLILENIDLSPEEVMKHVLGLLTNTSEINKKIRINGKLYKIKYKELVPDDHILFLDEVKNIINCKYIYVGVLIVSKCIEENGFNIKNIQKWQMEDDF